ncbi:MAG TPA: glycerophosphodiester phosphodiesterase [Gemmatimonadales bacterium]|nr:glycerophosphodiester phosphodiesterase [Gemmatimonadales bacterium]
MIAHRGASGYAFENSPAAFREAVARGADGVELDVHATADGGIVVHHDPVLTGGSPLDSLTLAEATAALLPNGEPVPSLATALDLIGDRDVWVEVKALPPEHDAALLAVLDAGPFPARYAVHSFDHRITARLAVRRPDLSLGALLAARVGDPAEVLQLAGATTLWQEWTMIDPELVETVHTAGARLIAWTVNDRVAAVRLGAMGVDGLCGNFPDRLSGAA